MQRSTNITRHLTLGSLATHLMTATFAHAAAQTLTTQGQPLIRLLEQEMQANTNWVRIHAAEALIQNGYTNPVAKLFTPLGVNENPSAQIGAWRVMAQAAETEAHRRKSVAHIRHALLDEHSPVRLEAAESLAKLGSAAATDRPVLERWLKNADEAKAPFVLWLLLLSSSPEERGGVEARLAKCLDSPDPLARLRTAFALGRLETPSPASLEKLAQGARRESSDSPARVYMITAQLLHEEEKTAQQDLIKQLAVFLNSTKPNEQLEAATVLGMRGAAEHRPGLMRLLQSQEPDARIGAANGLLHLIR
jgi:HEAT repeat protein